ncbi:6-phosphogluconate dehydrogenase-like protein NAD-binding protein [Zopfia rhizophila CBS 207.26]|uniref:6-phosphogluconate dehydrogenase-like protein NAD-binding protein n=1 Tax=Zopfia rhizophila CBS 207.26 TaxID=1314779 RepID=A0A6A6ECL2_9PEZI|nr:6-phosphogluconate dehydrogenase-like protein NAD-binding protein [Zopfia rhizophila CBS 207.26]
MSSITSLRLGWIGLGSMGLEMAKNIQVYLQKSDFPPLHYSNRTISRGKPLAELGGVPCRAVGNLVQICNVIFVSVSNDEVLRGVMDEVLSSGSVAGKIIVDTTTVHPKTSASVSEQLRESGAYFIAAPVFGATPLAQSGQLIVATAGPPSAIQIISPFLKGVIARNVIEVGIEPEKALLLKTTSNFITAGLMYLISEAHVLAEKSGLPASVLENLIGENFGKMAFSDSERMTQGVYYPAEGQAPYSDLDLGIKDVSHGLSIAESVGVNLKVGGLVIEHMKKAKEYAIQMGRHLDSSSMYGVVRKNAGLDFETDSVKERDMAGNK